MLSAQHNPSKTHPLEAYSTAPTSPAQQAYAQAPPPAKPIAAPEPRHAQAQDALPGVWPTPVTMDRPSAPPLKSATGTAAADDYRSPQFFTPPVKDKAQGQAAGHCEAEHARKQESDHARKHEADASPAEQLGEYEVDGLTVTVVEAKNLFYNATLAAGDPYVRLTLGVSSKHTHVAHRRPAAAAAAADAAIEFNEKFDFEAVHDTIPAFLLVEVLDKNSHGSADAVVGRAEVPLADVARGETVDKWYPLVDASTGKPPARDGAQVRLAMHPTGSIRGKLSDAVHGRGRGAEETGTKSANPIKKLKAKLAGKKQAREE